MKRLVLVLVFMTVCVPGAKADFGLPPGPNRPDPASMVTPTINPFTIKGKSPLAGRPNCATLVKPRKKGSTRPEKAKCPASVLKALRSARHHNVDLNPYPGYSYDNSWKFIPGNGDNGADMKAITIQLRGLQYQHVVGGVHWTNATGVYRDIELIFWYRNAQRCDWGPDCAEPNTLMIGVGFYTNGVDSFRWHRYVLSASQTRHYTFRIRKDEVPGANRTDFRVYLDNVLLARRDNGSTVWSVTGTDLDWAGRVQEHYNDPSDTGDPNKTNRIFLDVNGTAYSICSDALNIWQGLATGYVPVTPELPCLWGEHFDTSIFVNNGQSVPTDPCGIRPDYTWDWWCGPSLGH